jgi:hypothetical protein
MDSGPTDIQTSDDAQDFNFAVRDSKGIHADIREDCTEVSMVANPVLCVTVPCHGCDIDAAIRVCPLWCPQSVILKHPQPHLKGQEEPESILMLSHPSTCSWNNVR